MLMYCWPFEINLQGALFMQMQGAPRVSKKRGETDKLVAAFPTLTLTVVARGCCGLQDITWKQMTGSFENASWISHFFWLLIMAYHLEKSREILNPVRTSCNPVKTLGSDFKERLDGISRSANHHRIATIAEIDLTWLNILSKNVFCQSRSH